MLTSNNCYPPWLAQDECLVSQVFGCSSLPTPLTRGSRTELTLEGSAKRWEAGPRQISSKGDLLDSIWVGGARLNSVVDAAQRKSL
jgi:hypothetical protein